MVARSFTHVIGQSPWGLSEEDLHGYTLFVNCLYMHCNTESKVSVDILPINHVLQLSSD